MPPLKSVNLQEESLGVNAAENRIDMEQYRLTTSGMGKDQQIDLEAHRSDSHCQLRINPDTLVYII